MDSHQWIVVADAETREGLQVKKVFEHASLQNPVYLIHNINELFAYLQGQGIYGNREKFPLPVVLIIDMNLLGPEAANHLRRMKQCDGISNLPIMVMVEPGQENALDVVYEAGATTYLQKPFTFAKFIERGRIANIQSMLLGGH